MTTPTTEPQRITLKEINAGKAKEVADGLEHHGQSYLILRYGKVIGKLVPYRESP